MAANPRIPELPQIAVVDGTMIIPVYDYVTDTTYFATLQDIISIENGNDYRWDTLTSYSIGEIATYNGKIWESLTNLNLNNVPFTGSTFWVEQSKSLGGLAPWVAGTFLDAGSIVTSNITGVWAAYRLSVAVPFVSSDFLAELKLKKWVLLDEVSLKDFDATGGAITIACLGGKVMRLKRQDIGGNKTWSFTDIENLEKITIFVNLTGGGSWDQDFSSLVIVSDNGNWDSSTKIWSPIQAGRYKITIEWTGTEFFLSVSNLAA